MRHAVFALALFAAPAQAQSLYEAAAGLDLFPCDLSNLSCTTLTLPLDHRANDPDKTIDITFALSFATVESQGILFYQVGGPGASGLASADSYLSAFDESLTQYMDIVFVDQRGTGPNHGLTCPIAQARFDASDVAITDPEGAKSAARTYVTDCIAELDRSDILPFVASDQAIRDAEAFRQAIGAPKVWLYGESYGTQFVQAFATAFPTAVKGVILDGVVDLSLDSQGFYTAYTLASEAILARTLAGCADIGACARDMGGDAAAVFDDLKKRLEQGPIPVSLTLADGQTVQRNLTSGLFDASAFYALYAPEGRAERSRQPCPLAAAWLCEHVHRPGNRGWHRGPRLVRRRLFRDHLHRLRHRPRHPRRTCRPHSCAGCRTGPAGPPPAALVLPGTTRLRLLAVPGTSRAARPLCRG
jgi:pimeloyl-ACP methyl ester carboxylesterase